MININETSANSKIYIQRNITNDEPVINKYVTEDELQEQLKNINIPYLVIDHIKYDDGTWGYGIVSGDFNKVYDAIVNRKPQIMYVPDQQPKVFYIPTVFMYDTSTKKIWVAVSHHNAVDLDFTYYTFEITENLVTQSYQSRNVQEKLVSGENIKTINGNDILGEGDITIESNVDLSDYYTKGETDNKYQPKGNYLTSIPEEYVTDSELTEKGYATEQWVEDKGYLKEIPYEYITETELNDALANVGGGIPYLWVTYNETDGYKYIGSFTDVIDAIVSQKPFIVYVPSGIHNYYTTLELVEYNQYMINGVGYTHTYDTNYFTQWMLYKDSTQNKRLNHINEYAEKSYVDEQLGNINNLLENIIG